MIGRVSKIALFAVRRRRGGPYDLGGRGDTATAFFTMGIGGLGVLDKAVLTENSHGLTEDSKTVAHHYKPGDGPVGGDCQACLIVGATAVEVSSMGRTSVSRWIMG